MVTSTVVGTLTGTSVVVRNAHGIAQLHSWQRGGFGELVASSAPGDAGAAVFQLQLSLVEAYFLAFEPGEHAVLQIHDGNSPHVAGGSSAEPPSLDEAECWSRFRAVASCFPEQFAAYRALRAAHWHVRTGVKVGADFTLYPPGSADAHAAACALVLTDEQAASHTWRWLQQHVRLCQGVAKELLLCHVAVATLGGSAPTKAHPSWRERASVTTVRVAPWSAGRAHAQLSM